MPNAKNTNEATAFLVIKALSYVAQAAMAGAALYTAAMAIRYWPGISV